MTVSFEHEVLYVSNSTVDGELTFLDSIFMRDMACFCS